MYGHRECEAAHLPDDAISYREFGMKDYNACAIYDESTRGSTYSEPRDKFLLQILRFQII